MFLCIIFNGEFMKIIKFGGTSLQTPTLISNAIEIIKSFNDRVVVVISAIGRKGFPYATDTLIDSLKGSYLSKKEMDRLLSIGETYSSILLSNELNKQHINSYSLSYREIGLTCDKEYGKGNIVSINKEKLKAYLNKYQVVIVPGFLAKSNEFEVITLGRGTSDYSTILVGDILEEKEVTLFKDIDGIYPTIQYPLTKMNCFEKLSYDEVLTLCSIGYFVVNKKAILSAKEKNIVLTIKNFILNNQKTVISNESSNRKIIGFNLVNNQYYIATFSPEEIRDKIDNMFKKHHIFIKNYEIKENFVKFSISSSQGLLIRQILLNAYFKDLLK